MTDNLLKFSANLNRDQLLANQPKSEISCHVNIASDAVRGGQVATSAHICLVFDCSFSMAGKKFETAMETAKRIVDILHERHWISLVAFEIRSHVVFKDAIPSDDEKENIKQEIDKLANHLGGSTNTAAGIKTAMDVLADSKADADVIVILSDGVADSAEKAQLAANEASKRGIQIFAVGMGESYNTDQLLRLVTPSNGAVFGDSDVDKIYDIFYGIINRIDQIFASKVKLEFTFDAQVKLQQVYKTSPERALYSFLTINSDYMLDLGVGNVENNKKYEFLLKMEVGSHEVGTLELVKVRLQYDINQGGITRQQVQEVILNVEYTENDSLDSITDNKISSALNSANMMQLSDEVVQAFSKSDNTRAINAINQLQEKCEEENNAALAQHLDSLKIKLESGHRISDKDRNDFILASTVAPPEVEEIIVDDGPVDIIPVLEALPEIEVVPEVEAPPKIEEPPEIEKPPENIAPPEIEALPDADLYDFILVDPGTETIRLLREIRNTTNMEIPEIANIIKSRNSLVTVFKNKSDAEQFQAKLISLGATVKIQASAGIR